MGISDLTRRGPYRDHLLFPRLQKFAEKSRRYLNGDLAAATKMQVEYLPLINALFSEVNPIPAKAAMAKLGFCENYLRMPLTPMEEAHAEVLYSEMRKAGLNI